MNRKSVEVFHGLMKKGWIDRRETPELWAGYEETEVQEELEDFKSVLGFDLIRAGDRLYLVPTQQNDLFLKNNYDYRRDIKADNSVRNRDLYLMNYLSVYLLYLFFGGEGNNPQCRDFISREELIQRFTAYCRSVESTELSDSDELPDYSENFLQLSSVWMSKVDGEPDSQKSDSKYGILNKILVKYRLDEIFEVGGDNLIRPTRKLRDLMPYFLRKNRIAEIQNWIREGSTDAEDQ